MNYSDEMKREKFRSRARVFFFSGVVAWIVWFAITVSGGTGYDAFGAFHSLMLLVAVVGTYAGVPLMIRSRYSASEPTPWKAPAGIAAGILLFALIAGFIPNETVQLVTSWVVIVCIPAFIALIIWAIVLFAKGRRPAEQE